ncbi:MAG: FecR domain-containing protein [Rhodocyclales bacterium]|nr:FecR domain-containing protein [Rhodocyclales bacterium]
MALGVRLLLLVLLLPAALALAAPVGRVQFVAGVVHVESATGQQKQLRKGDELDEGDTVVTGREAQAQLLMVDGAQLAVRQGTRLRFDRYRTGGGAEGEEEGFMALLRGSFRSITGLIGRKRPSAYRVSTPTATIGIRGTDHEPMYIPQPAPGETPPGPPGTYDKVNVGQTFIENASGRIELGPNQAGFAPLSPNLAPVRLPQIPAFMRQMAAGKGEARGSREGEQRKDGGAEGDKRRTAGGQAPGGQGAPQTGQGQQPAGPAPSGTQATGSAAQPAGSGVQMPPGGVPVGPAPAGIHAPLPGGLPLPGTVAPPLPPPIKGTLDLTSPPQNFVAAPNRFIATGGDLSGSSVGSGAGVVGDNFGVALDANGNMLSVGGSNFSYNSNAAPLIQQGAATVGGIPVHWGIYAGGQISDSMGVRNPSRFHFMGAPNATPNSVLVPVLTAGGPMTFTAAAANNEYTKPIAETGAVGGTVGLSITLNNLSSVPSVTAYTLSVSDAIARNWNASLSGGPVSLSKFLGGQGGASLNVTCTGCAVTAGAGSAHGAAIGSTSIQAVISSYDLKAGAAGVTGSVLAR